MSAEALQGYLEAAGILTCNVNPYLPSLSDVGCTWGDAAAVIDRHGLFYCKFYRKRTTYLSPEVYYLLKACVPQKPMAEDAAALYALLEQGHVMESDALNRLSALEAKRFTRAFNFLLEQRYITALANSRYLNPNWSVFSYGTADAWERLTPPPPSPAPEPLARLNALLRRTMPETERNRLLRR